MPDLDSEVSMTQSLAARGKNLTHHTCCFPAKLTKYFVTRKLINQERQCPIGESSLLYYCWAEMKLRMSRANTQILHYFSSNLCMPTSLLTKTRNS